MLIRRTAEHVAEEPRASTERSHYQSRRAPDFPCSDIRGQQVKGRYRPLATRDIIDNPKAHCKQHNGKRHKDLRHPGWFWYRIHVHAQSSVKISSGCAIPSTA